MTLAQGVRSGNLFSKRDSAVLDAPTPQRALREGAAAGLKRRAAVTEMPLRRDSSYANKYPDSDDFDSEFPPQSRRSAVRVSFRAGLLPKSRWGRIAAATGFLLLTVATIAAALWVRTFLLHDEHFIIPTSESIQIAGNSHLTRAQLLSVFGEDVDRNIFAIPLGQRRAELESLPWVAHATVMRLLPNRVKVAIVERTPVAFVRQGAQIGLVDAHGVLFDLPGPDMLETTASAPQYSFPVLTGILAGDPLSTRAARMKIYMEFISALDASGEGISRRLSEVNVANPEDVQAIIPDSANANADVLVHFGEEKYLQRYHQYQSHLAEWRAQYPKLASVDMRYEQQVVLNMQKDSSPAAAAASNPKTTPAPSADGTQSATQTVTPAAPSTHTPAVKAKPAKWKAKPTASPRPKNIWHPPASKPLAQGAVR